MMRRWKQQQWNDEKKDADEVISRGGAAAAQPKPQSSTANKRRSPLHQRGIKVHSACGGGDDESNPVVGMPTSTSSLMSTASSAASLLSSPVPIIRPSSQRRRRQQRQTKRGPHPNIKHALLSIALGVPVCFTIVFQVHLVLNHNYWDTTSISTSSSNSKQQQGDNNDEELLHNAAAILPEERRRKRQRRQQQFWYRQQQQQQLLNNNNNGNNIQNYIQNNSNIRNNKYAVAGGLLTPTRRTDGIEDDDNGSSSDDSSENDDDAYNNDDDGGSSTTDNNSSNSEEEEEDDDYGNSSEEEEEEIVEQRNHNNNKKKYVAAAGLTPPVRTTKTSSISSDEDESDSDDEDEGDSDEDYDSGDGDEDHEEEEDDSNEEEEEVQKRKSSVSLDDGGGGADDSNEDDDTDNVIAVADDDGGADDSNEDDDTNNVIADADDDDEREKEEEEEEEVQHDDNKIDVALVGLVDEEASSSRGSNSSNTTTTTAKKNIHSTATSTSTIHNTPNNNSSLYNHALIPNNTGPYLLPPLSTFLDYYDDEISSSRQQQQNRQRNSNNKIIGPVPSDILHYAIVGFGKCGTTTISNYLLSLSSRVQALKSEVWALPQNDPGRLVSRLYRKLPDANKLRGYKCPGDLLSKSSIQHYQKYFPRTKFIIGVRHPVLWFQSLYNFRVQNFNNPMKSPLQLMGRSCGGFGKPNVTEAERMTCTRRGFFAYYLMKLGKHLYRHDNGTDKAGNRRIVPRRIVMEEKEEHHHRHHYSRRHRHHHHHHHHRLNKNRHRRRQRRLSHDTDTDDDVTTTENDNDDDLDGDEFDDYYDNNNKFNRLEKRISKYYGWENELDPFEDIYNMSQRDIFLYDVHQLADTKNASRQQQFRHDLNSFLGIAGDENRNENESQLLGRQQHGGDNTTIMEHISPGRVYDDDTIQQEKDSRKINICDDEYWELRAELMDLARMSSEWIRTEYIHGSPPGVYFSNREHLEELLKQWMHDPCDDDQMKLSLSNTTKTRPRHHLYNKKKRVRKGEMIKRPDHVSPFQSDNNSSSSDRSSSSAIVRTASSAGGGGNHWPISLDGIIDTETGDIVGDPQPLLDFAIIGFGKCGTTTILKWLNMHPSVSCLKGEIWALMHRDPNRLIRTLYHDLPPSPLSATDGGAGGVYNTTTSNSIIIKSGTTNSSSSSSLQQHNNHTNEDNMHRCIKCPLDITQWHILDYYRTLFPRTKFIVGVRHPVLWFQSLYNFRVQTRPDYLDMTHPNEMIGVCVRRHKMVCTRKGNFAAFLMRLGKQYYKIDNRGRHSRRKFTELEDKIANRYRRDGYEYDEIAYMPNEVFIYELGQLSDLNTVRRIDFSQSMQSFLDLPENLRSTADDVHITPTQIWNATEQTQRDAHKMNICDDEYLPVRRELMELGRMSSTWIRDTFLDLPGVHYASREHLDELLASWMYDPCGNNKTDTITQNELDAILNVTRTTAVDASTPTSVV